MATVEDLQKQISDMKEKTKAFILKLKDDHTQEINNIKQQNQVNNAYVWLTNASFLINSILLFCVDYRKNWSKLKQ